MNLTLNAKQKKEIADRYRRAGFSDSDFNYCTKESQCVEEYVQHPYHALSGYEPTQAQGICLTAEPGLFFTFERGENNHFYATCNPELEVGRILHSSQWAGLLSAFADWLKVVKLEIHSAGLRPKPPPGLEELLRSGDMSALRKEFERAERSCEQDPPSASTAACAAIEAVCKVYIDKNNLTVPNKETVKPLWDIVRKHLFPETTDVIDQDMLRLMSGLTSVVDGVGSSRTHGSSAHGRAPGERTVTAAEARLAVHAAYALAFFVLEKMR